MIFDRAVAWKSAAAFCLWEKCGALKFINEFQFANKKNNRKIFTK